MPSPTATAALCGTGWVAAVPTSQKNPSQTSMGAKQAEGVAVAHRSAPPSGSLTIRYIFRTGTGVPPGQRQRAPFIVQDAEPGAFARDGAEPLRDPVVRLVRFFGQDGHGFRRREPRCARVAVRGVAVVRFRAGMAFHRSVPARCGWFRVSPGPSRVMWPWAALRTSSARYLPRISSPGTAITVLPFL